MHNSTTSKKQKNGPVKALKKSVKLVKACFVTPGMDKMRKEVEDSLFLPHETFHPETASTNMTYRSFHPGRTLTAIEFDFFILK